MEAWLILLVLCELCLMGMVAHLPERGIGDGGSEKAGVVMVLLTVIGLTVVVSGVYFAHAWPAGGVVAPPATMTSEATVTSETTIEE